MTAGAKLLAVLLVAIASRHAEGAAQVTDPVHVVRRGETLWTIAASRVGDGALWPALYRANRDQIRDPAVLHPGQRLTIPELSESERETLRAERSPVPGTVTN